MKHLLFIFLFLTQFIFSQSFENGSFENNTAGSDQINLSNADCNLKLRNVNSFGSYGDVDIISSSSYGGGGAQDDNWYLGITGGGTDVIALSLTEPLVAGKAYTISYYDRKTSGYQVAPIEIGLSTSNDHTGTRIYTCKDLAVLNTWTQHTFTFIAPNNGRFITVQMQSGALQDWVNIDNFVFNNSRCNSLNISASAISIDAGSNVTFTAQGGSNYKWASSEKLSALTGSIVNVSPTLSTIYTVTSYQKECPVLTATVLITVTPPKDELVMNDTVIKKDSVYEEEIVHHKKTAHLKKIFNKHRVNGRKFLVQESLTVSNSAIKIFVWDKNRVDGDEVSIYLNGELIIEELTVTKAKKEIIVNLEPGKNIIVMHALNLGSIPPNTVALTINDGTSRAKIITLVSTFKKSGALEIFYDPLVRNN